MDATPQELITEWKRQRAAGIEHPDLSKLTRPLQPFKLPGGKIMLFKRISEAEFITLTPAQRWLYKITAGLYTHITLPGDIARFENQGQFEEAMVALIRQEIITVMEK